MKPYVLYALKCVVYLVVILGVVGLFIWKGGVASNSQKSFRVGMSWLVKDVRPNFTSYEQYEVTKVEEGKVTWRQTLLNEDKKPFKGDKKGREFTRAILKVSDLAPGTTETIKAAGRSFECRKITTSDGNVLLWRSLEYPIISVRNEVSLPGLSPYTTELVEFKP